MGNSEEILNFFKNMTMCSDYDIDRQVSEQDMKTILEVGRLSPSSFGLEPWEFLVVEDRYIKKQLFNLCWGMRKESLTGSYLLVILSRNAKSLKYNSDYVRHILKDIKEIPEDRINLIIDRYKLFLEDDFDIIEDERAMADWGARQSYLAMANMMIAAEKLGISSCPIEGFNKKMMEDFLIEEGLLDKDEFDVTCLVSFGYKKESPTKERKRRAFEDVVKWI